MKKKCGFGRCSHRFTRHPGKYLTALHLKCAPGKCSFQGLFSPYTSPYHFICTRAGTPYTWKWTCRTEAKGSVIGTRGTTGMSLQLVFTGSPKTYIANWLCCKTQLNLGCNAVLIIRNKLPCLGIFNLWVGRIDRRHPLHKKKDVMRNSLFWIQVLFVGGNEG